MPDEPEADDESAAVHPELAEAAAPGEERPSRPLSSALEPPPEDTPAEGFKRRARLAEDRLAEVLAAYRKLKAENDAHRQRVTKNLERRFEQRIEALLVDFIDILDNFDRALEATEQTYAGNPLVEGLILVRTQLLQTLQEQGLERIPALGLPFDPAHSEAVETRLVGDPDHHHLVVKEMLRGYKVHGRVVRASRVVVGQYPAAEMEATSFESEEEPANSPHALEDLADGGLEAAVDAELVEDLALADAHEAAPAQPPEPKAPIGEGNGEQSLEDIVGRAEAQEALFPGAFDDGKE